MVFSNLSFGNHVKKFGSNFNQDFSFLSKSNLKCLFVSDTKQLLDEVEHDIKNYQNRGLCYLPKPNNS